MRTKTQLKAGAEVMRQIRVNTGTSSSRAQDQLGQSLLPRLVADTPLPTARLANVRIPSSPPPVRGWCAGVGASRGELVAELLLEALQLVAA